MADWADIANLWWLKPRNPGGQSSLPAFALGAQMQQQRIQNDIRTKEFALDQQYRMEQLRQQDKLTTAKLMDYERLSQDRQDEQDDMLALKDIMGPLAENKPFDPPQFKTEKGWRAFSQVQNSFSLNRWRQRLSSEARKQQAEYYEKLGAVKQYAPDVFAEIWKQVEGTGEFSPEMIGQIDEIYSREVLPQLTRPPEGMETGAIRQTLPGGESVTFRKPVAQRTERLPQSRQDVVNGFVAREARRLQELGQKPDYAKLIEQGNAYADELQQKPGEATPAGQPAPLVPQFKFVPGRGLVPIE